MRKSIYLSASYILYYIGSALNWLMNLNDESERWVYFLFPLQSWCFVTSCRLDKWDVLWETPNINDDP